MNFQHYIEIRTRAKSGIEVSLVVQHLRYAIPQSLVIYGVSLKVYLLFFKIFFI